MALKIKHWMQSILISMAGVTGMTAMTSIASATPALPASTLATDAVRAALSVAPTPTAPAQASAQATQTAQNAAATRAAAVAQVAQATTGTVAGTVAQTPIRGRTAIVRATAYNSVPGQTDSTPFITATGTRTRPGVVALSRDLLKQFPYGSKIMIEDLTGRYNNLLQGRVFIVEDTMAARKTNSLDIWMTTRSEAVRWGARQVRITAVR